MNQKRNEKAMTYVYQLRREKGWSQERLAQISDVSVRTIQRIEAGQSAGMETLNCLAAVFEVDVKTLMPTNSFNDDIHPKTKTEKDSAMHTIEDVKNIENKHRVIQKSEEYMNHIKAFKLNAFCALLILPALWFVNEWLSPQFYWITIVAVFWGIAMIIHAITIKTLYGAFNLKWHKAEIEDHLSAN
ncbi:helix-turn-helix domain-containing protein [Kordiimonas sp. SCSIO 12610]|uniref:helix-turn-helix domain-containing protein n=1 Tax=Kordiimonas sp. SCSIO 12610 TaxID=2829597 RepID=UPI00210E496A|nr:helix-turn-helix domain-containing protein [Kordiimonas sp. SCSIO 12610]UTW56277.1 helix-turn-helix domain-containing protein [Kordiimonas sp. SCSIO 12610]